MGKLLVKVTVSIAVLTGLLMVTDTSNLLERLRSANLAWLCVTLICLTLLTFLMAKRWQIATHMLDLDLSYGRAVREYYLAQLVNMVLPGGVIGDAARAVRLRRAGDLIRAAQSVMLERLIGQVAMFGMMFVGFVIVLSLPGGVAWPRMAWAVLGLGLIATGIGYVIARKIGSVKGFLVLFGRLMRDPTQLALSTAIALLTSFGFYASAQATGTALPLSTLFTMIPLILTSMLIPLSVGGWGWREGAAAALFPLAGASANAGIATGIAYGAMMLIAALPAVFIIAFSKSTKHTQLKQVETPQ